MYMTDEKLKYVTHLQEYLDRLIKLEENDFHVSKEINDVLNKINRAFDVGCLPDSNDLIDDLAKRFRAKRIYISNDFGFMEDRKITKATLKLEYDNGDAKTFDIDIPSEVVIVPTRDNKRGA